MQPKGILSWLFILYHFYRDLSVVMATVGEIFMARSQGGEFRVGVPCQSLPPLGGLPVRFFVAIGSRAGQAPPLPGGDFWLLQ